MSHDDDRPEWGDLQMDTLQNDVAEYFEEIPAGYARTIIHQLDEALTKTRARLAELERMARVSAALHKSAETDVTTLAAEPIYDEGAVRGEQIRYAPGTIVLKLRAPESGNTYRGPVEGVLRTHLAEGWCFESVMVEPPRPAVCPECVQGKHGNCDGTALDRATDEVGACECEVC